MIEHETSEPTPILVERASGLPEDDKGWELVPRTHALRLRRSPGNDLSSATLIMHWGVINDANDPANELAVPIPPLAVDDCVRLRLSTIENGKIVPGAVIWHGVVESIDWSDPERATIKAVDLAVLLARTYCSRGLERSSNNALFVDPGYAPPINAIPGGDRSTTKWDDVVYVHDRRGTGVPWSAHEYADSQLHIAMRAETLPGAPTGVQAIPWRLDPASAGDYTPDTLDPNGLTIAAVLDRLFSAKRGLTWRVTVAGGYAQVLVIDLSAAGQPLDTTAELDWENPIIQERRDGYDYVLVSGARPLVGITLYWKRGATGGSLEPDGWDPDTAGAALDQALLDEVEDKPYDRPEWRRFKVRLAWDGAQYDGTVGGSGEIGVRNVLVDPNTYAPPDGDRWWLPPVPPPTALTLERELPAGQGWTDSPTGPRQAPVVIAGSAGAWEDLSVQCRPTPIGAQLVGDRNDQGSAVLVLGDSAAAADRIREAVGASGWLLITIGVREWAPLQCAWAAPSDAWSVLSPRVYHLRRPGIEQWICLSGSVTGIDGSGNLTTLSADLETRDDLDKLRTIRDQLAVRFGRAITAASITCVSSILTSYQPGDVTSTLTLVDGRAYPLDMPLAEIDHDFERWKTTLRWAPLIKETPSA
jgi:hypothetical protein